MKSCFDSMGAFEPMFDDVVVVRGSRPSGKSVEQTLDVCVFAASDSDPITGEAMDAEREDISVCVKSDDWRFVSRLQRGDTVEWNGRKYAFLSAKNDASMGWIVKARGLS